MYGSGTAAGGATAGAMLPVTGFNIVWYAVAGFTLVSAGLALLRLLPKRTPAA
ncbi:LPXTG-motif cell wall-anchored protein [Allocatelliglobosispora scoriae]|uniref:LPXTG-motif cell wall-anchored protein n=1 Tax=Allocatelliglobosispora scoriae TaxID=643052 RepID=A0A841BLP8_9ACTN|nr:LPXTG cell wall anchor domain-containing protein [Allocatelliglobosispora scoriae]MBB5868119.1 LPXTG-motif cell wall-anchored protein [Allocatelliglobosispora scoriae]